MIYDKKNEVSDDLLISSLDWVDFLLLLKARIIQVSWQVGKFIFLTEVPFSAP